MLLYHHKTNASASSHIGNSLQISRVKNAAKVGAESDLKPSQAIQTKFIA